VKAVGTQVNGGYEAIVLHHSSFSEVSEGGIIASTVWLNKPFIGTKAIFYGSSNKKPATSAGFGFQLRISLFDLLLQAA
jgi:hypothetical protein